MLAPEFVENNPRYYDNRPESFELWSIIHKQAADHTRRHTKHAVLDIARPNESDTVKEYREANYRFLTKEGIDKFLTKSVRIFQSSTISTEFSEVLTNWLEESKFVVSGQQMDVFEYFYTFILPKAIEDPNSLLVAFPQHNGLIPPALPVSKGGHPPNEPIPIETIHLPHDKIVYVSNELLSWHGGKVRVDKNEYDFYFIADTQKYYIYYPVKQGNEVKLVLFDWYNHAKGELPLNYLPGRISTDGVRESFLHSYFEYADEFVSRFSDGQAVWVQHAHPKAVLMEQDCPECKGSCGTRTVDKNGEEKWDDCASCHGTGIMRSIGPYDVLVRPKGADLSGSNSKVLEYISPEPGTLEKTYEVPFDLFNKAKRSIGLDLLENLNESGTAKEHRLEDLQDLLNSMGHALIDCIDRYLWDVETLLVLNPGARKKPNISKPISYAIKSPQILKEEAETALSADRIPSQVSYYQMKYANNILMQKVYEYALFYSPLLTLSETEVQIRIASGTYTEDDLVKRDWAVQAFIDLSDKGGFENWNRLKAKQEADSYLIQLGVLNLQLPIGE